MDNKIIICKTCGNGIASFESKCQVCGNKREETEEEFLDRQW